MVVVVAAAGLAGAAVGGGGDVQLWADVVVLEVGACCCW